jgi:uncharacterized membrane protein YdfJ with MMPL/SSD domain
VCQRGSFATDYAVILLSRIKEALDSGIPNNTAVAIGLERTGRIVTAAATTGSVPSTGVGLDVDVGARASVDGRVTG